MGKRSSARCRAKADAIEQGEKEIELALLHKQVSDIEAVYREFEPKPQGSLESQATS